MLISDVHFKSFDLDRIIRTTNWINSLPNSYNISRAIICGDLFTTRTSQPTHVLSACYRFLNKLVEAVPHVNIILGNHDLAYRLDYTTSALEALSISRLSPFVTLHTEIGCHEWDGRHVFVMPFRDDQSQIIDSVRDLDPKYAATAVGFGHLAINRAITQKYVVKSETGKSSSPIRYPGLTGASNFAPLARTFTGHFHSHQTILQAENKQSGDLQGSITYIGAPLQLTWADLFDTQKGAILLDPETLEHELISSPYAEGYTAVDVEDVLAEKLQDEQVQNKHVMVLGKLSRHKYISARDSLAKLGARSVRDWKPFEPEWTASHSGLGKTMLPIDMQSQSDQNAAKMLEAKKRASEIDEPRFTAGKIERESINLDETVDEYLSSLTFDSTLEERKQILTVVGKRLVNIGNLVHDKTSSTVKYRDMLDLSTPATVIPSSDAPNAAMAQTIFAAHPVSVEITNFLGVQGTLNLEFKKHFVPGVNFIVGHNGAGKSTIIEAMVWCQFGQCIRDGLGVNDVVNDVVKKNCNVRLTFANGYTISRSRNHSEFQNRVIVEKDGIIQSQFEGPNTRSSQASINELLGVEFETFIRTILLGNESTRSFLSASSIQRRQLTETALGLGILDRCAEACNSMLGQVDEELNQKKSELREVTHTLVHLKGRMKQMGGVPRRLRSEGSSLASQMDREEKNHIASLNENSLRVIKLQKALAAELPLSALEPELSDVQEQLSWAQAEVSKIGDLARLAQARLSIDREGATIKQEIKTASSWFDELEKTLERLVGENDALEIPVSLIDEERNKNKHDENKGASDDQGFLPSVSLFFGMLWESILKVINFIESKIAAKAIARAREVERQWNGHVAAIFSLSESATKSQFKVNAIRDRIATFPRDIARQNSISEDDVHTILRDFTVQEALRIPSQLSAAIAELNALQKRDELLRRNYESHRQKLLRKQHDLEGYQKAIDVARRRWEASLDRYEIMLSSREREISTYEAQLKSDAESLAKLSHQAATLGEEAASIHSHREIFAFWQSSFTRRQVSASKATFRRYVTERHLGELNKLLGQILMVMYQDANYARNMTKGTIGALFKEDHDEDEGYGSSSQKSASVLEPSLSINPSLAYAKRSGGERKRVDLALFFALFMMGEARSPHMAGYMLVDEAFDSLDDAGQASVLKWCRWMTERLAYVFVITHNRSLVRLAEKEGDAENGVGANVVTVKAGTEGVELVAEGDQAL